MNTNSNTVTVTLNSELNNIHLILKGLAHTD